MFLRTGPWFPTDLHFFVFFFFFSNFIYSGLWWVFVATQVFSLVAESRSSSLVAVCGLLAAASLAEEHRLSRRAAVLVVRGLSRCSSWLQSTGSVRCGSHTGLIASQHGGVFPDLQWKPRLPHWQALPLSPREPEFPDDCLLPACSFFLPIITSTALKSSQWRHHLGVSF